MNAWFEGHAEQERLEYLLNVGRGENMECFSEVREVQVDTTSIAREIGCHVYVLTRVDKQECPVTKL